MVEWVCTDHGYRGQYGRRKVHESILVIWADQPGPDFPAFIKYFSSFVTVKLAKIFIKSQRQIMCGSIFYGSDVNWVVNDQQGFAFTFQFPYLNLNGVTLG